MLNEPRKEQIIQNIAQMDASFPQLDFYIYSGETIDDIRTILQEILADRLSLTGIDMTDSRVYAANVRVLDSDYTIEFAPGAVASGVQAPLRVEEITGLRLTLTSDEALRAIEVFRAEQGQRLDALDAAFENLAGSSEPEPEAFDYDELTNKNGIFVGTGEDIGNSVEQGGNSDSISFGIPSGKHIDAMRRLLLMSEMDTSKPGLARCQFESDWLPASPSVSTQALQFVLREEFAMPRNMFTIVTTPPTTVHTQTQIVAEDSPRVMALSASKEVFLSALSAASVAYLKNLAGMTPDDFAYEMMGVNSSALRSDSSKMDIAEKQLLNVLTNIVGNGSGIEDKVDVNDLFKTASKSQNFEFSIVLTKAIQSLQNNQDIDPRKRVNGAGGASDLPGH